MKKDTIGPIKQGRKFDFFNYKITKTNLELSYSYFEHFPSSTRNLKLKETLKSIKRPKNIKNQ